VVRASTFSLLSTNEEIGGEAMSTELDSPKPDKPSDANDRLLEQLKEHVVQIEAINVYTVLCIGVLFLASAVDSLRPYVAILACAFLAGIRVVVRVTNPTSSARNRLTWGATLGGIGATIGTAAGALIDIASFGLTAGAATATGLGLGAAIGTAAGDRIEKWRNQDQLMERGKAFEYLYGYRHKNPRLSNPNEINNALDKVSKYDINSDGRLWYTIDDLEKEARKVEPTAG
jgi:hypothetical protein